MFDVGDVELPRLPRGIPTRRSLVTFHEAAPGDSIPLTIRAGERPDCECSRKLEPETFQSHVSRGNRLMTNRLIPPPELAPSTLEGSSKSRGIELWADWLDTCDEFLLAGLRRRVGPGGNVGAAYREWYAEPMKEHDRTMLHLLEEFERRSRPRGRFRG